MNKEDKNKILLLKISLDEQKKDSDLRRKYAQSKNEAEYWEGVRDAYATALSQIQELFNE